LFESHLNAFAEEARAAHFQSDPWEDRIVEYCTTRNHVTRSEILSHLGVRDSDQTQAHANRVADVLRRMGFMRRQIRSGAKRFWRYERMSPDSGKWWRHR